LHRRNHHKTCGLQNGTGKNPVLPDFFCISCSVFPVRFCAVLSFLFCFSVLSFVFYLSRSVFLFCLTCYVFPVLPVPFCPSFSACPIMPVPFCLSRSGSPMLASFSGNPILSVLPRLILAYLILALLCWQFCAGSPLRVVLSWKSCPGVPVLEFFPCNPVLAVLSCRNCSACPVLFLLLPVRFCLSCSACPVLPVPFCPSFFCLSCSACPVLPVQLCLSCSASLVLPFLFCLSCVGFLSWLSSPCDIYIYICIYIFTFQKPRQHLSYLFLATFPLSFFYWFAHQL
jgi:hypothetical protein